MAYIDMSFPKPDFSKPPWGISDTSGMWSLTHTVPKPGHDGGKGQRKDDLPEGGEGRGAQVVGGVDQGVGDPLQAGVDGQDHVGQPQVGEDQPHGHRTETRPFAPDRAEHPVENPFLGQDVPPGVDLDHVAGPQRQQHGDDEGPPGPRACHLAMVKAMGKASTAVVIMTAAAILTVRRVMTR